MSDMEAAANKEAAAFLSALSADFENGRSVKVYQPSSGKTGASAVLAVAVFEEGPLAGERALQSLQQGVVFDPAAVRQQIRDRALANAATMQ